MKKEFISKNPKETQELARQMARDCQGGEIFCLVGELGAGKTTFTQGFLEALGAEGPFTSPTFVIMKEYIIEIPNDKSQISNKSPQGRVYHFDAYRVGPLDILNLGWPEIIAGPRNIVIMEWAEKVKDMIPPQAVWIEFKWIDKDKRRIIVR